MQNPEYIDSIYDKLATQWSEDQAVPFRDCALRCYEQHQHILQHQATHARHWEHISHCKNRLEAFSSYHAPAYRSKVQQLLTACLAYRWEAAQTLADELVHALPEPRRLEEFFYFYPLYLHLKHRLQAAQTTTAHLDEARRTLQATTSAYRTSIRGKVEGWATLTDRFDALLHRITRDATEPAAARPRQHNTTPGQAWAPDHRSAPSRP